jgi:surfeit locus 1 family protein
MLRRLPVIPTLVVLAAVAVMIRLGFWQIDRMHEKEAMLARYEAARSFSSDVPYPRNAEERERALFRHSSLTCTGAVASVPKAGRNDRGESGWAHVAPCSRADGGKAEVVLGWSRNPAPVRWEGGEVFGFVAPGGALGSRLVVHPPQTGLAANAVPDPRDIPNNHWSYAVQWFLFAGIALVIYALAVRGRLRG